MINISSNRKKLIILSIPLLLILSFALLRILTHERDDRPNIILISIDTLRADHLGCYGYFKNTTPNIDKFSNDSVLFSTFIDTEFSRIYVNIPDPKSSRGIFRKENAYSRENCHFIRDLKKEWI